VGVVILLNSFMDQTMQFGEGFSHFQSRHHYFIVSFGQDKLVLLFVEVLKIGIIFEKLMLSHIGLYSLPECFLMKIAGWYGSMCPRSKVFCLFLL